MHLSTVNILRPRQNGRHFADDIFKCIFVNENARVSIKISKLLFLMIQLTIFQHRFRWLGAGQASSHCLNQWWLVYWRIYASLGLNELRSLLILGFIDLDLQFYFQFQTSYFSKLCVSHSFASFYIYLVRPSPVSVPHPTWQRTYTDFHECGHGPAMDRETVYHYILVRPLEFQPPSTRQLALDFTRCYRFSPYYIRFACRNFICQLQSITETTIKLQPLTFILFQFQAGEACLSAIFSVVNTYAIQNTRLFHILTRFVHVGPLDRYAHHRCRVIGRELWTCLGDSVAFHLQTWSPEYRAENTLQSDNPASYSINT